MKKQSTDKGHSRIEFLRQIGGGNFAPLYLFEGTESLLREEALKELVSRAVPPDLRDFNVSSLSVVGGDIAAVLEVAGQLPMMASRRVVVVRGFESISDDAQIAALDRYLANPNPLTSLVFASDALDNRRNITALLRRTCKLVSFQPFTDGQDAVAWIRDYIAGRGAKISGADSGYLVALVGNDLRRLASEGDKLAIYVGEGGSIKRQNIDDLVPHTREHTNFEISDAVRDGNRTRALRIVDQVFSEGNDRAEAPALLGAIAGVFRRLVAAKEMMAEGLSPDEIARTIGGSVYWLKPVFERARKLDRAWLMRSLERIAETDVAIKSSLGTPRLQLEFLICDLCPLEQERSK